MRIILMFIIGLIVGTPAAAGWTPAVVDGGSFRCLVRDPVRAAVLYACTAKAAYVSTDDGASWRTLRGFSAYKDGELFGIAIAPDGRTMFFAVGFRSYVSTDGGVSVTGTGFGASGVAISPADPNVIYMPIKRSLDGGRTWVNLGTQGLPGTAFGDAIPHPTERQTVLLLRNGTIYRSTDGGSTWSKLYAEDSGGIVTTAAFDPFDARRILVGTSSYGLVQSLDGGVSWTRRSEALPITVNSNNFIKAIHFDSGRSGRVLVVLWIGAFARTSAKYTLFESEDGSMTFRPLLQTFDRFNLIATSPSSRAMIHVGGEVNRRTLDGGQSWSAAIAGVHEPSSRAGFVADPHQGGRVVAAGFQVVETRDGGRSWSDLPSYLPCESWLVFDPAERGHALCGPAYCPNCLYETRDGMTWTQRSWRGEGNGLSIPRDAFFVPGSREILVAYETAGQPAAVLRSVDGGTSGTRIAEIPSDYYRFTGVRQRPSRIYAWGTRTLARSDDGSRTWTSIQFPGVQAKVFFAAAQTDGEVLIAGGSNSETFVSRDAGRTWREITYPYGPQTAAVGDDGRLLLGNSPWPEGLVVESRDGGTTWTPLDQFGISQAANDDGVVALGIFGQSLFGALRSGGVVVHEPASRRRSVRH